MEQGFIKLHRSILDWEWFEDEKTFKVFIYLLLNAQWEDSRFKGYDVPRGSLVTSYSSIAKNNDISVKNARTAINHLKSTGEVAIKSANKFSIITIVNWEKYQGYEETDGNQNGNQSGNQAAIKRQSSGNIKEIKNIRIKEEKNNRTQKFDANKGLLTSYTPELFAELERETRSGRG